VHSESEWASVASVASLGGTCCWLLLLLLLLLLGRKLRRWKKRRGDLRLPNDAGDATDALLLLLLLLLTLDDGDGVADALLRAPVEALPVAGGPEVEPEVMRLRSGDGVLDGVCESDGVRSTQLSCFMRSFMAVASSGVGALMTSPLRLGVAAAAAALAALSVGRRLLRERSDSIRRSSDLAPCFNRSLVQTLLLRRKLPRMMGSASVASAASVTSSVTSSMMSSTESQRLRNRYAALVALVDGTLAEASVASVASSGRLSMRDQRRECRWKVHWSDRAHSWSSSSDSSPWRGGRESLRSLAMRLRVAKRRKRA